MTKEMVARAHQQDEDEEKEDAKTAYQALWVSREVLGGGHSSGYFFPCCGMLCHELGTILCCKILSKVEKVAADSLCIQCIQRSTWR